MEELLQIDEVLRLFWIGGTFINREEES